MLAPYSGVEVVEQDGSAPANIDVLLFDPFLQRTVQSRSWSANRIPSGTTKLLYTWERDPRTIDPVLSRDAHGYVFKGTPAPELVDSIRSAHRGDFANLFPDATLLNRTEGLSPREAQILSLIAEGLSNEEISKTLFLGINSIKSYIRTGYRKIGVQTRAQAVIWALTPEPPEPPGRRAGGPGSPYTKRSKRHDPGLVGHRHRARQVAEPGPDVLV